MDSNIYNQIAFVVCNIRNMHGVGLLRRRKERHHTIVLEGSASSCMSVCSCLSNMKSWCCHTCCIAHPGSVSFNMEVHPQHYPYSSPFHPFQPATPFPTQLSPHTNTSTTSMFGDNTTPKHTSAVSMFTPTVDSNDAFAAKAAAANKYAQRGKQHDVDDV